MSCYCYCSQINVHDQVIIIFITSKVTLIPKKKYCDILLSILQAILKGNQGEDLYITLLSTRLQVSMIYRLYKKPRGILVEDEKNS